MWAADDDDKIYAYNMSTKSHDAAGNNIPQGLWSDGTAMWVSDYADRKISVYSLAAKAAVP